MENQFVVGVADVRCYDENGELVMTSKTMLNSSMEISTGSTEISGGKRNKLLNIYYHTGRLNLTLEDTVFNIEWIRDNVGGKTYNEVFGTSPIVPYEIGATNAITVGLNTLPVNAATPVALDGTTTPMIYINGISYEYNVSNNGFVVAENDENIGGKPCLQYFVYDNAATSYVIPAAITPKRLRVFLSVSIASNRAGEGDVGELVIEVPVFQLSGGQTISMTADGYSTTPLNGMALAYTPSGANVGCGNKDIYAIITKRIYETNWYDDVINLAVIGGDIELEASDSTQLNVVGITQKGETKSVVWNDLSYTKSGDAAANLTVSTTGLVTSTNATVGNTANIVLKITDKPTVTADLTVTIIGTPEVS